MSFLNFHLGAMIYGGETCYLGAVGHGGEKKVQSQIFDAQRVKREFLTEKRLNYKKKIRVSCLPKKNRSTPETKIERCPRLIFSGKSL
jgi:hypothetical protein